MYICDYQEFHLLLASQVTPLRLSSQHSQLLEQTRTIGSQAEGTQGQLVIALIPPLKCLSVQLTVTMTSQVRLNYSQHDYIYKLKCVRFSCILLFATKPI